MRERGRVWLENSGRKDSGLSIRESQCEVSLTRRDNAGRLVQTKEQRYRKMRLDNQNPFQGHPKLTGNNSMRKVRSKCSAVVRAIASHIRGSVVRVW